MGCTRTDFPHTDTEYSYSGGYEYVYVNLHKAPGVIERISETRRKVNTSGGGGGGGTTTGTPKESGITPNTDKPTWPLSWEPTVPSDDGEEEAVEVELEVTSFEEDLGWTGGARSAQSIDPTWTGVVSFDVPDTEVGLRPTGVAAGLAREEDIPTSVRYGYGHLASGLVFVGSLVVFVTEGDEVGQTPYAPLRAARTVADTDLVTAEVGVGVVTWSVNGVVVFASALHRNTSYALDATLYASDSKVDNPAFTDALGDVAVLVASIPALRLQGDPYAYLEASLPAMGFLGVDGDGRYAALAASLPPLVMWATATTLDDRVEYATLRASLPPLNFSADASLYGLRASIGGLSFLASDYDYSELRVSLPPLGCAAAAQLLTPLVFAGEVLKSVDAALPVTTVSIVIAEHVGLDGTAEIAAIVMAAQALEEVTAQDGTELTATLLESIVEQLGAGHRLTALAFRSDGIQVGSSEEAGEAWVVNMDSRASTRYDAFGFNSFAALGARHFAARQDGVYLLEGRTDAGLPIVSGVALGKHDFGTQALKHIDAVYAGVSSCGQLYLKVGDGKRFYTYKARHAGHGMQVHRFDIGKGLRTNYFTFELTSERDAFELDSITFQAIASTRRI